MQFSEFFWLDSQLWYRVLVNSVVLFILFRSRIRNFDCMAVGGDRPSNESF